jgi:DNA-binding XRE family transcriptional regulator
MRAAVKMKAVRPEWAVRIEKLRDRLQLSQTEFAKKLDVSAMAISRWERGVNEPPANCYLALGKMAGLDGCWYFWERAGITKSDVRRFMNER